jgi:hypothetical protein
VLGATVFLQLPDEKEIKMQLIKKGLSVCRKVFAKSIANIKAVRVRYWWLILLSALIHRLPFAIYARESFADVKRACMILSYVLLLWALSRNFNFRSIRIMTLGTLLNFVAIVANSGLMPVSPEARQLADMTFLGPSQFGMVLPEGSGVLLPIDQTNLLFLTDIIPASHLGGVYSPGDVLIGMGFIIFLLEVVFGKSSVVKPALSSGSVDDVVGDRKQVKKEMAGQLVER